MDIRSYLVPDVVMVMDEGPGKWVLMEQMLDRIVASAKKRDGVELDRAALSEALRRREEQQSTGLGSGCALPHARVEGLVGPQLALAVIKKGMSFDSLDGKPVTLVCMVLVPLKQPTLALKIQSKIAWLNSKEKNVRRLMEATDAQAVCDFLGQKDMELAISVLARDLMRKPVFCAKPDMPVTVVTHNLMQNRMETAPVVDDSGSMLGEITCDRLFQYGMPDFFNQLKTVSFIAQFDPFEKYFADEGHVLARDVMSREYASLPETATLLEILFELTVKRFPKVFILRGPQLVGVIDRSIVLDQVINF